MSKVSDIFNKLIEITQATLPNYNHLPDGLEPEKNSDLELNNGFSVNVGDSNAGPVQYGCQFQLFERTYQISITNIYALKSDPVSRDEYELAIMEDLTTLIKAVLAQASLGGLVCGLDYVNDIGPQYLSTDKQEFLYTDVTFLIKYEESLA